MVQKQIASVCTVVFILLHPMRSLYFALQDCLYSVRLKSCVSASVNLIGFTFQKYYYYYSN